MVEAPPTNASPDARKEVPEVAIADTRLVIVTPCSPTQMECMAIGNWHEKSLKGGSHLAGLFSDQAGYDCGTCGTFGGLIPSVAF